MKLVPLALQLRTLETCSILIFMYHSDKLPSLTYSTNVLIVSHFGWKCLPNALNVNVPNGETAWCLWCSLLRPWMGKFTGTYFPLALIGPLTFNSNWIASMHFKCCVCVGTAWRWTVRVLKRRADGGGTDHRSSAGLPAPAGWAGWGRSPWTWCRGPAPRPPSSGRSSPVGILALKSRWGGRGRVGQDSSSSSRRGR